MANTNLFNELSSYVDQQQQMKDTAPIRRADALANIPAPATQTGQAEAAIRNAVDGATMGFGDSVAAGLSTAAKLAQGQSADYATEEAAIRARTKLSAQEWPKTAAASGIAGSLATMAVPGLGVAKGATFLGAVARGVARGAAASAANAVGHASGSVTDRLAKAPEAAAIGAVVGGAAGAVGGAFNAFANKKGAAEGVVRSLGSDHKAIRTIADNYKDKGGLAQAGKELVDGGYVKVGKPIQEVAAHLERDAKSTGEEIGALLTGADKTLGRPVVPAYDVFFGLDKAISKATKENSGVAQEIRQATQAPLNNLYKEFVIPAIASGDKNPSLTLSQLQNFRTTIRDAYTRADTSDATSTALKTIERHVQDTIKSTLKRTMPHAEEALNKLDGRFSLLSSAGKLAEKGAASAEAKASQAIASGLVTAGGFALSGNIPVAGSIALSTAAAPAIMSRANTAVGAARHAISSSPLTGAAKSLYPAASQSSLQELFRQNQ